MSLRFSATNPPEYIEYQGCRYQLKKAAIPAKQAEQKLEQIYRAMDRVSQQGYTARPVDKIKSEWDVDQADFLNSSKEGETPKLFMWNPITSELLFSAEDDFDFHVDLHDAYEPSLQKYVGAGYDDWLRGFVSDGDPQNLVLYGWGPLLEAMNYFNGTQNREAISLQKEGNNAFKRMLALRAGNKYNTDQVF